MKNRVISIVLVVSMLLSMCQTVFAETFTEQSEQNTAEVISNDITIEANADSPKGNNIFDPNGDATRAELAQIFFNMFK